MQHGKVGEETIGFRRHAALPGVEIRDFENSGRRWRCYATGFELFVPRSWEGEIRYGRERAVVGPGMLFCARPHDVFTTPRVLSPGGASVISIEAETFDHLVAARGLRGAGLVLRSVVRMSAPLRLAVETLLRQMHPSTDPAQLRSGLADLVAALVAEVVLERTDGWSRTPVHPPEIEPSWDRTRFSRFQLLRAFKHRYGLPPHAYQLLVRIGLAQQALRAGRPAADVAADQGFVDQSHFTRRFKQVLGVTPHQYAGSDRLRGRRACRPHAAIAYKTAATVRLIGRT